MAAEVSITEAAQLLGLHRSRVHALIQQGRIKGARRVGHMWIIPLGKDGQPRAQLNQPGRPRKTPLPTSQNPVYREPKADE